MFVHCCTLLLRLQAEYREKRRQYLARFHDSPPDPYSCDLDDFTCRRPSSSSGDQDGAQSSPGVAATVCRCDSVSSGDTFVDVRASGSDNRTVTADGDPVRDEADADSWSMGSLPGGRLVDQGDDGRVRVRDRRSVSASDPNLEAHYTWLNGIDDASEATVLADVQPTPDVEELDVDACETQAIIHEASTTTADGTESTGPRVQSAATTPTNETSTDNVECDLRRSLSSPSSSSQHQRQSSAERLFVNKQILLNSTSFETS